MEIEEIEEIEETEEVEAEVPEADLAKDHEKCIQSHVLHVDKKHKFLSNQQKVGQFTAVTATENNEKNSNSSFHFVFFFLF